MVPAGQAIPIAPANGAMPIHAMTTLSLLAEDSPNNGRLTASSPVGRQLVVMAIASIRYATCGVSPTGGASFMFTLVSLYLNEGSKSLVTQSSSVIPKWRPHPECG